MRIVKNIIIGGLVLFFGFLLYPKYITNIYTPLYNLYLAQNPSPPETQGLFVGLFWEIFPFALLFAIIGMGIMWFMGKKSWGGGGGDTTSGSEGGSK